MRRLLIASLVLPAFASAVAIGSNGSGTAGSSSLTGTVTTVSSASISVHGVFDVTCTVEPHAPAVGALGVGDRVKIRCEQGRLVRVKRLGQAAHPAAAHSAGEHVTGGDGDVRAATPFGTTTAAGIGTITVLGSGAIAVTGERTLWCKL